MGQAERKFSSPEPVEGEDAEFEPKRGDEPKVSFFAWKKDETEAGKGKGAVGKETSKGGPDTYKTREYPLQALPAGNLGERRVNRQEISSEQREEENRRMVERLVDAARAGSGRLRTLESTVQRILIRRMYAGEDISRDLDKMRRMVSSVVSSSGQVDVYLSHQVEMSIGESMLKGVTSAVRAAARMERERSQGGLPEKTTAIIGLNDNLDAGHEVDLVEVLLDDSGPAPYADIRLVQAKSSDTGTSSYVPHAKFIESVLNRLDLDEANPRLLSVKERRLNAERYREADPADLVEEKMFRATDFFNSMRAFLKAKPGVVPKEADIMSWMPDKQFGEMMTYILPSRLTFEQALEYYLAGSDLDQAEEAGLRKMAAQVRQWSDGRGLTGADLLRLRHDRIRTARIRRVTSVNYVAGTDRWTETSIPLPELGLVRPVIFVK